MQRPVWVAPTFAGCLIHVRLIGQIEATQPEGRKRIRNDRLVGVAHTPVNHPTLTALRDVDPQELRGIEEFFLAYNRAQGRDFRITGRAGPRAAAVTLKNAEKRFGESRPTQSPRAGTGTTRSRSKSARRS